MIVNLIINSITMVDLTNKEAKRVRFSAGKNMLTSERNHLGKSVIMKSLYYTLGAEVYYPSPIKKLNLLTYIDFTYKEHIYRVARLRNSFVLYCDGLFVDSYSSVGDFEEKLSLIFDLEINLVGKDQNGTIVKCPPAFYYMPYYIDQENGWSANSFSFDRMTQFDLPQRKNSFFFHLGVFDNDYVNISKRLKSNDRQIGVLVKENEKYSTVIETLNNGMDSTQMAFDISSLEHAISIRENEIKQVLDEIAKIRKQLVEAEDQFVQLTHDKEILSKYIKKKSPIVEKSDTELMECPRCGMIFERTMTQKLEKLYLLESLHDDYVSISENETKLERKIIKLRDKFDRQQNLLENYEKSLADNREIYNTYLKSKATKQLLKDYRGQILANTKKIEKLRKDNSESKKLLGEYLNQKNKANESYMLKFSKLLVGLDIPKDQIEENSEPGSSIIASGAYGPRCKIAQMLAFVETQKTLTSEIITFPIVIDSPNSLEQDKEHLDSVIRTILTWDKTDNQIIVASIEGRDIASTIPDVNMIELKNPQNHLFNANDYLSYESEISDIFTRF